MTDPSNAVVHISPVDTSFVRTIGVARVKKLMKATSSAPKISNEAVLLTNVIVELVIKDLCTEAGKQAVNHKKRTLNFDHIADAVRNLDRFAFLSSVIPMPATAQLPLFGKK
jgi:histone H3/H4